MAKLSPEKQKQFDDMVYGAISTLQVRVINLKMVEHMGVNAAFLFTLLKDIVEEDPTAELSSKKIQAKTQLSFSDQQKALEKLKEYNIFKKVRIV